MTRSLFEDHRRLNIKRLRLTSIENEYSEIRKSRRITSSSSSSKREQINKNYDWSFIVHVTHTLCYSMIKQRTFRSCASDDKYSVYTLWLNSFIWRSKNVQISVVNPRPPFCFILINIKQINQSNMINNWDNDKNFLDTVFCRDRCEGNHQLRTPKETQLVENHNRFFCLRLFWLELEFVSLEG